MLAEVASPVSLRGGPGRGHAWLANLPRGTIVNCVEFRREYCRVQFADSGDRELWVNAAHLVRVYHTELNPLTLSEMPTRAQSQGSGTRSSGSSERVQRSLPPVAFDPPSLNESGSSRPGEVSWHWGPRIAGAFQVVGGIMEISLGAGAVVVPEPATTIGGVILVAHGTDTLIAGFRTLWSGEVTHSLTQGLAEEGALQIGASETTAERVGVGVDLVAGIGPSIAMGVSRRIAISAAQRGAPNTVAVAYLHRGALQMGHNAVGVRTGGTTAWVHFAGVPRGAVQRMTPHSGYVVTELAVTSHQAARAVRMQNALMEAGEQTWRYMGSNCTTTAIRTLTAGGVVVPGWSVTPALLHLGVRAGPEITFMTSTIGTTLPNIVESVDSRNLP